jgi:hypothetical protein
MQAIRHQFVKPPNAGLFSSAVFEDKYTEASTLGLSQEEYKNSLQIISDVHQKNLKRVQTNMLLIVLACTTTSMFLTMFNMLLITQSNRLMQRDVTKAMIAAQIALLVIAFVVLVLSIPLITLVWLSGSRAQRKIKEESKEALNRATDLESQKFNGVRFFMEYPSDNKGLFAFVANWMFKPTLIISTNDYKQPETIQQTIFTENASLIQNDVNQQN